MNALKQFQFVLILFALFNFFACQNETVNETTSGDEQETIAANSTLTNLMSRTSQNDGSQDDILDNADCFSVNLPVTIEVSGTTYTINTLNDLEVLEDLVEDGEIDLEFSFPITITFSDYSQITIESEDQLEEFVEDCLNSEEDDDFIDCVNFQYPISFSIYNTDFQVIDTVAITNDEELFEFLDNLDENDSADLVSLNFPVTLLYENGTSVTVNTNQELEQALNEAETNCETTTNSFECFEDFTLTVCDDSDDSVDGVVTLNLEDILEEELDDCEELGDYSITIHETLQDAEAGTNPLASPYTNVIAYQQTLYIRIIAPNGEYQIYELQIEIEDCSDESCSQADVEAFLQECIWNIVNYNGSENFINYDFDFTSSFDVFVTDGNNNDVSEGSWSVAQNNESLYLNFDLDFEDLDGNWLIIDCDDDRLEIQKENTTIVLEKDCED